MSEIELKEELKREVDTLSEQQTEKVLQFTRKMKELRQGTPGHTLQRFIGSIPPEDLNEMMAAIEEGCERNDSTVRSGRAATFV